MFKKQLFFLIYKRFGILLMLLIFSLAGCKEEVNKTPNDNKKLEANQKYRPFIHHFSSTGCSPCGRFGVPVLNNVANEMGDSVFAFITHFKYNDPFITSSSEAIEQAILDEWYSPQIWIENTNLTMDLLNYDVSAATEYAKNLLRKEIKKPAEAYLGLRTNLKDNDRTDVELVVQNASSAKATYYVEVYGIEDGIVASQAGPPSNIITHVRVNRGGFYGNMGKEITLEAGAEFRDSFEYIPCWTCEPKGVYFNVIVWKQNTSGKYEYVNGLEVR